MAEVLVNSTTGKVVDRHLRIELALARQEATVPVTYVELSEAEERLVLASLDPLAAMAIAEKDALAALLAKIETGDAALARMLAELADQHGIRRPTIGDPDEVPPVPDEADVYVKPGDLWLLGEHPPAVRRCHRPRRRRPAARRRRTDPPGDRPALRREPRSDLAGRCADGPRSAWTGWSQKRNRGSGTWDRHDRVRVRCGDARPPAA